MSRWIDVTPINVDEDDFTSGDTCPSEGVAVLPPPNPVELPQISPLLPPLHVQPPLEVIQHLTPNPAEERRMDTAKGPATSQPLPLHPPPARGTLTSPKPLAKRRREERASVATTLA